MGMTMTVLILAATVATAADPCARDSADMAKTSSELEQLYRATRADYESAHPDQTKRNKKRIKTVWKLRGKGHVCTPEDKMHASWVLSRSRDAEQAEVAFNYAKEAMMHHVDQARWLTAVSYDRWAVARGLEQRYGTQRAMENGRLCIYPLKAGATDEERKQYGHAPIGEVYSAILKANDLEGHPPTADTLRQRGLFCDLESW